MTRYEECIETIERLFEENKPREAEKFMLGVLSEAKETADNNLKLQILNELLGYYRQTSEKERLLEVIEETMATCEEMELANDQAGAIPYATSLLNIANCYRSIGDLENSEKYYGLAKDIYSKNLPESDMLYAGLYNNMSLLLQEKGDIEGAYDYQLKALKVVSDNNAGFEIAVTYANLANTAVLIGQKNDSEEMIDKAAEYALEAVRRFEERNTRDAHYCAALSAFGMCFFWKKEYKKAADIFKAAMGIVESTLGRNSQYLRLKENFEMCDKHVMNGLKLSKLYYEQCAKPMIEEKFPEYVDKIAVGLVGEGSDCYGFDDETSRDHDWGPSFSLWVSDEVYEEIGEELSKAYEELPEEFMGYKREFSEGAKHRRGVRRIVEFYEDLLGTADYSQIDWRTVPEYALSASVNGEVFTDPAGEFSKIREDLIKGFPENILYLKLSDDMAKICQNGQYNYARMIGRGDRTTANMLLFECMKSVMTLAHHIENKFVPHDKWLFESFKSLEFSAELLPLINYMNESLKMPDDEALNLVNQVMAALGNTIAAKMYAIGYISDIEPYLDYHCDELVRKSVWASHSDEELVKMIAKLEFKAFDKVKNEGGRASCQNDWPTFSRMRKSQYMTWNRTMMLQYLYDFTRELERGHNLITEKYGRMMESTAREQYEEIKDNFPELSDEKKAVIEQIVAIQMGMLEEFGKEYPNLSMNTRSFHTYEDNFNNTSYETYLRGEISTYSDKMLQLYAQYVVECAQTGRNIARETIENTAKLYGYSDLNDLEGKILQ